jgi:SAM-dependent methyltransferase
VELAVREKHVLEVPTGLQRGAHESDEGWIQSARSLLDLVCRQCGLRDLGASRVLDMGCGTKITKALLDDERPIRRYVGIDVEPQVIEFLTTNVDDERFSFHHIDIQNDLYNPSGLPLTERTELPVGDEQFDIIWLFSVFTHLAPDDYVAMLQLLRRYISRDGWLVFSLYVNETTDTGYAPLDWWATPTLTASEQRELVDEMERQLAVNGEEWFARELHKYLSVADDETRAEFVRKAQASSSVELDPTDILPPKRIRFLDAAGKLSADGSPPDFIELNPDEPLLVPMYARSYAHQLVDGTGWEVVSLNQPEPDYIQHYFVCRPA